MKGLGEILSRLSVQVPTCDRSPMERAQRAVELYNAEEGDLHEVDGYHCPICKNKGDIGLLREYPAGCWIMEHGECKCMEVRSSIKRMKKSGLKNIIKDYTFDKFETTEGWQKTIKDAAKDYAANPSGWFFIGGQSGSGKSHICTAICREFLLSGNTVRYMLWRDDIVRIKAVANDAEEYGKLVDPFKKAPVLYIDDLFKTGKGADGHKQQPTAADVNVAFEIINYRYNNPHLLTLISSECTADDLLQIDEAIAGRILERAKVFSLNPDMRRNYRLRNVVKV